MKNEINKNKALSQTSVTGSVCGFLKNVVDEMFIYKTPPKIIEYVEKHKHDYLIQNPPYEEQTN